MNGQFVKKKEKRRVRKHHFNKTTKGKYFNKKRRTWYEKSNQGKKLSVSIIDSWH